MGELLDFLLRNPLLLLILGGMLLQGLGTLGAKAARKAAQEQRKGAKSATPQPVDEAQMPSAARPDAAAQSQRTEWPEPPIIESVEPPPAAEAPRPAIDLAGELRRAMGLDAPRAEPATRSQPSPPPPIRFEVVEPAPARRAPLPRIAAPAAPRPSKPRARRHRVDLSDPAAAIMMMEILGPPRGLRSFEEQRR